MTAASSNLPKHSVFAVWRWPPVWAVVALLLVPAYLLSVVPVDYCRSKIRWPMLDRSLMFLYSPAEALAEHSGLYNRILGREAEAFDRLLRTNTSQLYSPVDDEFD